MPNISQSRRLNSKATAIDDSVSTETEKLEIPAGKILLPRWVVYLQATLLGTCAITFFIFGMMAGSFTHAPIQNESGSEQSISGFVAWIRSGVALPDAGAVVMLLPQTPADIARQSPETIRPENFEPLENPTIEFVRSQGGSIVRTNIDGKFQVYAKPGDYRLLVISKAKTDRTDQKLSRQQVASLSQYFLPVEKLVQGNQYHWQNIQVESSPITLSDIEFD